MNVPGFRTLLKHYTHEELASLFEISSNFAAAHEAALQSVCTHRGSPMEVHDTELAKEVMVNLVAMDKYASEFYVKFPEIIEAVKVKLAARVMLATERSKVHAGDWVWGGEPQGTATIVSTVYHLAILHGGSF